MTRVEQKSSRLNFRTAHVNIWTAIIMLATAVASVGGTVFAWGKPNIDERDNTIAVQNEDLGDKDQEIASLSQDLSSANAQVEVLQEDIELLRQENGELRAALPPSVAPEDVPAIRATATVTLSKNGDTLDLNSTLPNFKAVDYVWQDTLEYNGKVLNLGYDVYSVVLPNGTANYETCAVATGWARSPSLEPHALTTSNTCLRLQSGRYATVQVLRFDDISTDVVVTVWDEAA